MYELNNKCHHYIDWNIAGFVCTVPEKNCITLENHSMLLENK